MTAVRRRAAAAAATGKEDANRADPKGAVSQAQNEQRAGRSRGRKVLRAIFALIAAASFSLLVWNAYYNRGLQFGSGAAVENMTEQTDAARRIRQPSLPFSIARHEFPEVAIRSADVVRRDAVKAAFTQSWTAYVEDAFGADEYNSLSRTGSNFSTSGGVGYFIIDVIDMLLILGEQNEYDRARDWVKRLSWSDKAGKFSVFETTIRTLGGLLSAHALCTPDDGNALSMRTGRMCAPADADLFLTKALELAEALRPAFESNRFGLPEREIDFSTGQLYADVDNRRLISLAEATTVQLEFKYLARLTDDERWWRLAERPMEVVRKATQTMRFDGLLPIFLNPASGTPSLSDFRLGSRGDSYYEYLIKQFLQTNRTELVYLDMYQQAMMGVKSRMLRQSPVRKMLHTAELHVRVDQKTRRQTLHLIPKQDHLVCFIGGSFMLGALHAQSDPHFRRSHSLAYPPLARSTQPWSALAREDWDVGQELTKTCVQTYTDTRTGLSPEIAMFRLVEGDGYKGKEKDWYVKKPKPRTDRKKPEPLLDARNILRPETVESLFIAFHLSGDPRYRDWGWQIFQSFERHARTPRTRKGAGAASSFAYAGIKDVNAEPSEVVQVDRMETFWLAETLKYLYLLFDDQETLRMDQWVFNTEAHPLPIFTPNHETNVF